MSQVTNIHVDEGIPEPVSAALNDSDAQVRAQTVERLLESDPDQAIERMLELATSDPEPEVRRAALAGLGDLLYMCGASAYDPETDHDDFMQCEGLSPEKVRRAFRFLLDVSRSADRSPSEQQAAIEAASCFSNAKVEDTIAELYKQKDKDAQISALVAMGRNGSERWLETVRHSLYHDDPEIQLVAVLAAGELGQEGLGKDLLRLTYAEDRELMMAAIWALGQTAWEGAFDRLDECTLHPDPEISEVADDALDEWLFFTGLEPVESDLETLDDDLDDLLAPE